MTWIQHYTSEVLIAACAIAVIAFLFSWIALGVASSAKRKSKRGRGQVPQGDAAPLVLDGLNAKVEQLESQLSGLQMELTRTQAELSRKVSTAQIKRFNAFSDVGSDLSFALAFLDDHADGVVVSSIYGREESRTYAKPIQAGKSTYALTQEEEHVVSEGTHSKHK